MAASLELGLEAVTSVQPSFDTTLWRRRKCVQVLAPDRIVLEATGGFELSLLAALGSAGLPVVAANPRQSRDFARSTGRLVKADALDAQVLAHFAAVVRPTLRPLPDADQSR
jgi:transposase